MQTPGTFLKQYFQNNPERLKNYVGVGLKAVSLAVSPLNALLRHLILIQGMDPNTEPGRRMREAFQQALNEAFSRFHDHSYDTDFDFSWLNQKFEQTRRDLKTLNLSKNDFRKMTDVGQLRSTGQTLDVATVGTSFGDTTIRPDVRPENPVTVDQTPVEELASLLGVPVNPSVPEPVEQERDVFDEESWLKAYGDIHSGRLNLPNENEDSTISATQMRDALNQLVKMAELFEEEEELEPTQLMARTEELKNLKKIIKDAADPVRPIKKTGKVHRVPVGKTDAVKKNTRRTPRPNLKTPAGRVAATTKKTSK